MSQEMNRLPADLAEVERMLGGLRPARAGLDRDRVMYDAGRVAAGRAGRKRERLWQGACAVLVLGCAGLAAGLVRGGGGSEALVGPSGGGRTGAIAREIAKQVQGAPAEGMATDAGDDAWAASLLLDQRRALLTGVTARGQSGGGGGGMPALRKGDGLEALPAWQRKAASMKGSAS